MVFLIFYFLLFTVLVSLGTHVAGEVKNPLGTLPEEVGQAPAAAARWGIVLIAAGLLGVILGLLGFQNPGMAKARPALFILGAAVLALYGLWVIFLGRKHEFVGKPAAADDHGHH